jgi:hypothetical protein
MSNFPFISDGLLWILLQVPTNCGWLNLTGNDIVPAIWSSINPVGNQFLCKAQGLVYEQSGCTLPQLYDTCIIMLFIYEASSFILCSYSSL